MYSKVFQFFRVTHRMSIYIVREETSYYTGTPEEFRSSDSYYIAMSQPGDVLLRLDDKLYKKENVCHYVRTQVLRSQTVPEGLKG